MKNGFSHWTKWAERDELDKVKFPGVYAIALSKRNIAGANFSCRQEIIYIGMTNSVGGLKSRLRQFENTIRGGDGHGGAKRVRYKHPNYQSLIPWLYVSVIPFKCDVQTNNPSDLRVMGNIAKQEYDCLALFVDMFSRLPEFNDKKRSLKN